MSGASESSVQPRPSDDRPPPAHGLRAGALGLAELVFQSIAHMAPAGAIAFSIPLGAAYAGGALPLAVAAAVVPCLLVALSIGELARELPSAGSFATWAARGIHPSVGFLMGWIYGLLEPLGLAGVLVAGSVFIDGSLHTNLWWLWAALAAGAVAAIGHRGIRTGGRTALVLGTVEVLVFAALVATLVWAAGDRNSARPFTIAAANSPAFRGWSGVAAGSVYSILAFAGFESAAPLAEESVAPRRTVGRAVIASLLSIAVLYVAAAYAATVFFGADRMTGFFGDGSRWFELGRAVWGAGAVMVFVAMVNSMMGNAVAAGNAATRTWYSLARAGLFPSVLGRVHPRHRSPWVANLGVVSICLGGMLVLARAIGPIPTIGLLSTITAIVVILVYAATHVSCLLYYSRHGRGRFSIVRHGAVPVLGLATLVPPLLVAAGIPVLRFIEPLTPPASWAGPVVLAMIVSGVVLLLVLRRRDPSRLGVVAAAPDHASDRDR